MKTHPTLKIPRCRTFRNSAIVFSQPKHWLAGYWLAGLWTRALTHYYLLSLPVALLGVFLGRAINHRFRGDDFLKYLYFGLAAIGALLLVQAIRGRF